MLADGFITRKQNIRLTGLRIKWRFAELRAGNIAYYAGSASGEVAPATFVFIVIPPRILSEFILTSFRRINSIRVPLRGRLSDSTELFANCLDFTRAPDCVIRREILLCSWEIFAGGFLSRGSSLKFLFMVTAVSQTPSPTSFSDRLEVFPRCRLILYPARLFSA